MMSRVLNKCQFTDPNERNLVTTKIDKEVLRLEKWFQSFISSLGNYEV